MRFATVAVLAALALAPTAAQAAEAPSVAEAADLPAGRYGVPIKGMLCAVGARAIAAEWAKLPAVEKATVDFESGRAVVTVRLGATLPLRDLRRALVRAERLADLGARYEMGVPSYLP